jgi:hypothetical protein
LRACITASGRCYWVEEDLCSSCVTKTGKAGPVLTSVDINVLASMPEIELHLDAFAAFELLATIQLACRHPSFETSRTLQRVVQLAKALQAHLSRTPNLAALCEAGWKPDFDVPAEEKPRIIVPP